MSTAPQLGLIGSTAPSPGCPVCHSSDVFFDEVAAGADQVAAGADEVAAGADQVAAGADTLHLAECPRCAHRWTWRAAPRGSVQGRRPARPRLQAARAPVVESPAARGVASAA